MALSHHTSPQLKKKKCEGREQVGRETNEDGFHIVTDADEFISTSSSVFGVYCSPNHMFLASFPEGCEG